jgi:TonB-dependent receptor
MGRLVDTGGRRALCAVPVAEHRQSEELAELCPEAGRYQSGLQNDYVEDDGKIAQDEDSYTSNEDIYAGYVMAKAVWGKLEVIGGVRVDHTRISSDNYEALALEDQDPVYTKVKGKASYTSVLPRLQVNYRASDDFVVRGAFYTSIARPEPLYISGATEIEEEDGKVDVTVGNPNLKPAYAYNFDLSLERYFGSVGLISGGLFYKKIDRFIFSGVAPETEGDRAASPTIRAWPAR